MKTNQEIALEVAKALRQDDLVASLELCTRFLAAVDAERGKDAVGYDEIFNAIAEAASPCGEGIGVSVKAFKRAIGGEIFLSPTIPQWQPIETAPKVGRHLAIEKDGFGALAIVWLDADHPDADGEGWYEHWSFDPVKPTHWMPSPPPPAGVTK